MLTESQLKNGMSRTLTFNKNTDVEHPGHNNFSLPYWLTAEHSVTIWKGFEGFVTVLPGLVLTVLENTSLNVLQKATLNKTSQIMTINIIPLAVTSISLTTISQVQAPVWNHSEWKVCSKPLNSFWKQIFNSNIENCRVKKQNKNKNIFNLLISLGEDMPDIWIFSLCFPGSFTAESHRLTHSIETTSDDHHIIKSGQPLTKCSAINL